MQVFALVTLGSTTPAIVISQAIQGRANLIALAALLTAAQRGHRITRHSWGLTAAGVSCWAVANGACVYASIAHMTIGPNTFFTLLYRFYAAPLLVVLFLPGSLRIRLQ